MRKIFDVMRPETWFENCKIPLEGVLNVQFKMMPSLDLEGSNIVIEQILNNTAPKPTVLRFFWPQEMRVDVATGISNALANHWVIHASQDIEFFSHKVSSLTTYIRYAPLLESRKIKWCGVLNFEWKGSKYAIPCEWEMGNESHTIPFFDYINTYEDFTYVIDSDFIVVNRNYYAEIHEKNDYLGSNILNLIPDISEYLIRSLKWNISYNFYYPNTLFSNIQSHHIEITPINNYILLKFKTNKTIQNTAQLITKNDFIKNIRESTQLGYLIFLNIRRFKLVNETIGLFAADEILFEIQNRFKEAFGKESVIQWYGDRFLIYVKETLFKESDFLDMLAKPFFYKNQKFNISFSVLAHYLQSSELLFVEDVISRLENEINDVKEIDKNRLVMIPFLETEKKFAIHIESDLLTAVQNNDLYLLYQPIVALHDKSFLGAEALVRWKHPIQGIINPDNFIPLAEESGLIDPLTTWVFERACLESLPWIRNNNFILSINISPSQFSRIDFVDHVQNVTSDLSLNPNQIKLEITETIAMSDDLKNKERLQYLKEMGFLIAIDDFGTGQAGFHYLKNTSIDTIKFDKSLIRDISLDSTQKLIQALILLIHDLGMKVLAEGIESEDEFEILKSLGCDYGQGYYFGRPMTIEGLLNYIKT